MTIIECRYVEQSIEDGLKDYKPEDFLVTDIVVGKHYRAIWASSNRMFWQCDDIDKDGKAVLITPKTRKIHPYPVEASKLRATRRNAVINKFRRLGLKEDPKQSADWKRVLAIEELETGGINHSERDQTSIIIEGFEANLENPRPLLPQAEPVRESLAITSPSKEPDLFTNTKVVYSKYWSKEETDVLRKVVEERKDLTPAQIAVAFKNYFPRKSKGSIIAKSYMIRKGVKQIIITSEAESKPYKTSVIISDENIIDEEPVSQYDIPEPDEGMMLDNEPIVEETVLEEPSIEEEIPTKVMYNANDIPDEVKVFKNVTINSDIGPIVVDIKITGIFKIEILNN